MATLTFPLSRIEGHARVVIEVREGKVTSAQFQAMEMRGFDYFIRGTPAEQMPVIVPRICGVCSTAHQIASVKTLEDAFGVTPPPLAREIRELLLLGQLVQNQATSLFIFTMPDRLNVTSLFQQAEVEASEAERDQLAGRALQVRRVGTELMSLAGGKSIHPITAIVGGVANGIAPEAATRVREQLEKALPIACELYEAYWSMSQALRDRIGTWGDDTPAYYIASTGAECPRYDSESIRVMDPAGIVEDTFGAREFRAHLGYEQTEFSYSGQTSFKGQAMRANSLARINMTHRMGTPLADRYLERFRADFGRPAHAVLFYDLCRGIELVYALERAIEILSQPLEGEELVVPHTPHDGEGYGLVEAPRGPLIHHYCIEQGIIASAEFIIPTVHNMLAIEHALQVAAQRYITADQVNMELESAVGRVVRAFDPCIACATH